ncbi:MAG: futalosine hydrolase, partial [Chitinophagaceae bacterium]
QYRVDKENSSYKKDSLRIKICVTGIGCIAAAYALGKNVSAPRVDLAVQAGIAGAFSRNVPLGKVMRIESDILADLGAEEKDWFIDLFDLGFLNGNDHPYIQKRLMAPLFESNFLKNLPKANAITVNTVSGQQTTIHHRIEKYHPDLESMEGAAFHYVCLMEKVKFIQIRSVSNYVEIRDRSQWEIALAIKNLNDFLIQWIENDTLLCQ